MANCNQCGRDVGCGCNLVNGMCLGCIAKNENNSPLTPNRKRPRYTASKAEAPPLVGFEGILKTQNISKEEKIRRINEILEQARKNIT